MSLEVVLDDTVLGMPSDVSIGVFSDSSISVRGEIVLCAGGTTKLWIEPPVPKGFSLVGYVWAVQLF